MDVRGDWDTTRQDCRTSVCRLRYSSSSGGGGQRQSVTAGRVAGRVDTEAGSPGRVDNPSSRQPANRVLYLPNRPVVRPPNPRTKEQAAGSSRNVRPGRCGTLYQPINRRPRDVRQSMHPFESGWSRGWKHGRGHMIRAAGLR
jgi:hypothetical protein